MMTKEEAEILIDKYNEGIATFEETKLVHNWFVSESARRQADPVELNYLEAKDRVWAKVAFEITPAKPVVKLWPKSAPNWIRGIAVAAAVTAIALCVYFFAAPRNPDTSLSSRVSRDVNDIAPGKNGATITLANGKVIRLSGAKTGVIVGEDLKYSDGSTDPSLSRATSLPQGERDMMLTASTAKGQTYQFTLPDGTKVWLNADSKISFPSQFNGKERKILLTGEAYFAVVHDSKQPFRVESNGQIVEDIGTEFNINAYADENSTKTTLLEGSASVTPLSPQGGSLPQGERAGSITLKPNQQAILSPLEGAMPAGQSGDKRLKVTTIDPEQATSWKAGLFMFDAERLDLIMKRVARWYNIEVVYDRAEVREQLFSGSVSRFNNVSSLLRKLEQTGPVKFKIEGRTIHVSK
jgi:transmembrane sensor